MRHLGSLLLALSLGPLVPVLAARGLAEFGDAIRADGTDEVAIGFALAGLGLAGLIYALLTMVRFSPLGPTVAGLGYLAVGVWALADPDGLVAVVPGDQVGVNPDDLTAGAAVTTLLATPLLITLFSAARWQGQHRPTPYPGAFAYPEPTLAYPEPPRSYLSAPIYPESPAPSLTTVRPDPSPWTAADPPTLPDLRPDETTTEFHPRPTSTTR